MYSPCCTQFFFYWEVNKWTFLQPDHKVNFTAHSGAKKSIFDPELEKKSYGTREKQLFYSCDCCSRFAWASNFTLAKQVIFS